MPNLLMLWFSALSIVIGLAPWEFCATQFSDFILPSSLSIFAHFLAQNFALRLADAIPESREE